MSSSAITEERPILGFFRKRAIVVEAIRWDGTEGVYAALKARTAGMKPDPLRAERRHPKPGLNLSIHTLEGMMRADYGDWVILAVPGGIYPCKPHVFEASYDPWSEDDTNEMHERPIGETEHGDKVYAASDGPSYEAMRETLRAALNEAHVLRGQVGSVQAQCTELLEENRALRARLSSALVLPKIPTP